jgi:pimeloyl-ACP methyl ester carboxylesterase
MAAVINEMHGIAREGDPMRARYPDETGYVERDGVRTFYEVYGEGEPTIVLLPTWILVHSRIWKAQIPHLARRNRVIAIDGRGTGRSDRPQDPLAYGANEFAEDALAVMDATQIESAVLMSLSAGTLWNLYLCSRSPERVRGAAFLVPLFPVAEPWPAWTETPLLERRDSYDGPGRYNVHSIREDYPGFARWWSEQCLPEPHSTMALEYAALWAEDTNAETIVHSLGPIEAMGARCMRDVFTLGRDAMLAMARAVKCPTLVISGQLDLVTPPHWAEALAAGTGGRHLSLPMGHSVGRKPVIVNLALREFLEEL